MKIACSVFLMFFLSGCAYFQEIRMVRQMPIQNVDINNIKDGAYTGAFSYGGFEYKVLTTVHSNTIVSIDVVENKDTKYAKDAQKVIERILNKQTPDVDAVSGATTTSKALMKAVENSLVNNLSI